MSSPVMLTRLSIVDAVLIINYPTDLVKITSAIPAASADPKRRHSGHQNPSKHLFAPHPAATSLPSTSAECPSPPSSAVPTTPTADMDFCLNADFRRINKTIDHLRTGGFYYEGLSWQQANALLRKTEVGTFLVRDSADPRTMFSLSVQTESGPTSVRIHYNNGQFRLDSEEEESTVSFMPDFDCVMQLVEYFMKLSQSRKGSQFVLLDSSGRRVPIRFYRPLYQKVLPLQHLCRLSVNRLLKDSRSGSSNNRIRDISQLELPTQMKAYLRDYPYHH